MQTSAEGIALLHEFESCRLKAYVCPAGILTIGVGHTGPDVTPGLTITQEQADALLAKDLRKFEEGVDKLVRVELDQDEFDACVALSFNIGLGAFAESTLLKKLNAGDVDGAYKEFGRWTKANGKTLAGLVRRRKAEAALFAGDDWRTV